MVKHKKHTYIRTRCRLTTPVPPGSDFTWGRAFLHSPRGKLVKPSDGAREVSSYPTPQREQQLGRVGTENYQEPILRVKAVALQL